MTPENHPSPTNFSRIFDACPARTSAPRLVVFAGVHGNEPSGVIALQRVFEHLRTKDISLQGQLTGILGNQEALRRNLRYCDEDLNRLFLPEYIDAVRSGAGKFPVEDRELLEICTSATSYENKADGFPYFVDCHTTSSASIPYISMNEGFADSYRFTQDLPATKVIGVEKEIKGCLAEWLNLRGWHGFTFEAGQHQATISVQNQEAIIWLALIHAGCLSKQNAPDQINRAREILSQQGSQQHHSYQVVSSYRIREGEDFRMLPGFVNLQAIRQGEPIATSNGAVIHANEDAHILMPLYQKQGDFGFFIAQELER